MPTISPARTENEMSCSAVPKSPILGRFSLSTTNFGAPNSRARAFSICFSEPPIISSAMLFELSCFGSQAPTTLPPRRIVALSQSSLISCSLWLM